MTAFDIVNTHCKRIQNILIAVETTTIECTNQKLNFKITISIGATVGLDENPDTIIARADNMLYQAKESGRNQVTIC